MRLISINEQKIYTENLANKHQTGASVTPNIFNSYIAPCVHDLVRRYYGLPELYRYNYPIPPIAFEVTQLVKDYISLYLLKESQQNVVKGKVLVPDDFLHFSSASYGYWVQGEDKYEPKSCNECCSCNEQPCVCGCLTGQPMKHFVKGQPLAAVPLPVWKTKSITVYNDSQWNKIIDHPYKYPTIKNPVGKFVESYFRVAPETMQAIGFNYLRYPKTPYWNFDDQTVPGFPVYVPVGSQDIELPEILKTELSLSILDRMGIQVREPMLQEYADRKKSLGQ